MLPLHACALLLLSRSPIALVPLFLLVLVRASCASEAMTTALMLALHCPWSQPRIESVCMLHVPNIESGYTIFSDLSLLTRAVMRFPLISHLLSVFYLRFRVRALPMLGMIHGDTMWRVCASCHARICFWGGGLECRGFRRKTLHLSQNLNANLFFVIDVLATANTNLLIRSSSKQTDVARYCCGCILGASRARSGECRSAERLVVQISAQRYKEFLDQK